MRGAQLAVFGLASTIIFAAGCSRGVDPTTVLEPVDVVTGWYEAGIVDGKNKLVPSITLKLRNKGTEPIRTVQVNAVFRRVAETEAWGEHFGWAIEREPLASGSTTAERVLRSQLGYTSEQPRGQMLQNKEFVDAKVDIFLKQGSRPWAKLAEFPIARQLLTK